MHDTFQPGRESCPLRRHRGQLSIIHRRRRTPASVPSLAPPACAALTQHTVASSLGLKLVQTFVRKHSGPSMLASRRSCDACQCMRPSTDCRCNADWVHHPAAAAAALFLPVTTTRFGQGGGDGEGRRQQSRQRISTKSIEMLTD